MTNKEKLFIKKAIEWDLNSGKYKNLDELILDCEETFEFLGRGGFYGIEFATLIPLLKKNYFNQKKI